MKSTLADLVVFFVLALIGVAILSGIAVYFVNMPRQPIYSFTRERFTPRVGLVSLDRAPFGRLICLSGGQLIFQADAWHVGPQRYLMRDTLQLWSWPEALCAFRHEPAPPTAVAPLGPPTTTSTSTIPAPPVPTTTLRAPHAH